MQCNRCEFEAPPREFDAYDPPTGRIGRECPACGGRSISAAGWIVCYGGGPWEAQARQRCDAAAAFLVDLFETPEGALRDIDRRVRFGYRLLGVVPREVPARP